MMPHIPERLFQAFANLAHFQTFEIKQFQRLPLRLAQVTECLLQTAEVQPGADLPLQIVLPNKCTVYLVRFNVEVHVITTARQMRLPVACPAVRHLHNPYPYAAACRLEGKSLAKDVQETLLDDLFGFSGIAQNPPRDAVHEPRMANEQHIQSLGIFCPHQRHEIFIAQIRDLRDGPDRVPEPSVQFDPVGSLRPESVEFARQRHSSDGFGVSGQGGSSS